MKKLFASLLMFLPTPLFAIAVDMNDAKTIKSEKIEYDVKSGSIKTSGKTEVTNASGQRMTLTDSYMSQRNADFYGKDVKLWLGQSVYIESDSITRADGDTVALRATFTACDGCDSFGDAWSIWASKITHETDEENHVPIITVKLTKKDIAYGDTNCDGKVELSDAILIMQALANPNKYGVKGNADNHLTAQGALNGDVDPSTKGLTADDALTIQLYLLKKIDSLPAAVEEPVID